MSFSGSADPERDLHRAGAAGWPVTADDWERAAEEQLDPGAFGYIAGGAGAESTMRANLEAFEKWRMRPRMLSGNADARHLGRGARHASPGPFLLAPVGVLSIAHEAAEVAVGEASASSGVPMVLSSAATAFDRGGRGDECAALVPALLGERPRDLCELRAPGRGRPGYGAIVVTLDTLTLGWRPRDLRHAYLPFIRGEGCGQYFSDPVFLSRLDKPPQEDLLTAAATMLATFPNLG